MRYRVAVDGQTGGPDGAVQDRLFDYTERFAAVLVAAGFRPCRPGCSSRC